MNKFLQYFLNLLKYINILAAVIVAFLLLLIFFKIPTTLVTKKLLCNSTFCLQTQGSYVSWDKYSKSIMLNLNNSTYLEGSGDYVDLGDISIGINIYKAIKKGNLSINTIILKNVNATIDIKSKDEYSISIQKDSNQINQTYKIQDSSNIGIFNKGNDGNFGSKYNATLEIFQVIKGFVGQIDIFSGVDYIGLKSSAVNVNLISLDDNLHTEMLIDVYAAYMNLYEDKVNLNISSSLINKENGSYIVHKLDYNLSLNKSNLLKVKADIENFNVSDIMKYKNTISDFLAINKVEGSASLHVNGFVNLLDLDKSNIDYSFHLNSFKGFVHNLSDDIIKISDLYIKGVFSWDVIQANEFSVTTIEEGFNIKSIGMPLNFSNISGSAGFDLKSKTLQAKLNGIDNIKSTNITAEVGYNFNSEDIDLIVQSKNISKDEALTYWPDIFNLDVQNWLNENLEVEIIKNFNLSFKSKPDNDYLFIDVKADSAGVTYLDGMPKVKMDDVIFTMRDTDMNITGKNVFSNNIKGESARVDIFNNNQDNTVIGVNLYQYQSSLSNIMNYINNKPLQLLNELDSNIRNNIQGSSSGDFYIEYNFDNEEVSAIKSSGSVSNVSADSIVSKDIDINARNVTYALNKDTLNIAGDARVNNIQSKLNLDINFNNNLSIEADLYLLDEIEKFKSLNVIPNGLLHGDGNLLANIHYNGYKDGLSSISYHVDTTQVFLDYSIFGNIFNPTNVLNVDGKIDINDDGVESILVNLDAPQNDVTSKFTIDIQDDSLRAINIYNANFGSSEASNLKGYISFNSQNGDPSNISIQGDSLNLISTSKIIDLVSNSNQFNNRTNAIYKNRSIKKEETKDIIESLYFNLDLQNLYYKGPEPLKQSKLNGYIKNNTIEKLIFTGKDGSGKEVTLTSTPSKFSSEGGSSPFKASIYNIAYVSDVIFGKQSFLISGYAEANGRIAIDDENSITIKEADVRAGNVYTKTQYFSSMNSKISIKDNILNVHSLDYKSPIFKGNLSGNYNFSNEVISLSGPFYPIGDVLETISNIPLLGFLQKEGKSRISFSLDITGTVDDPKVSVNKSKGKK